MEKLKQIWEIVWPILKIVPRFLIGTPIGKRILAIAVIAAAKLIGISFSNDEVFKTIEDVITLLAMSGLMVDSWRVKDAGIDATKKLFYEKKFEEWFGTHGVASDGGVIFHEDGRYFMARFDENHWLISTEDGSKSKVIFERGRDKLIELCKAL